MNSHTLPVFVTLSASVRATEVTAGHENGLVMRETKDSEQDRRLGVWLADGTLHPEEGVVMTEVKGRLLLGRRLKLIGPFVDSLLAENPNEFPTSGAQMPFLTVTSSVRTLFRGREPMVAAFVTLSGDEDVVLDPDAFGRFKAHFDRLVETAGLPALSLAEGDAFTVHELGALAGEHTVMIVTNALGEASRAMDTRVARFVMERDFPAGSPNPGQPLRI